MQARIYATTPLEELVSFVNPFSGSYARSKCIALQDALKVHLAVIEQPSVTDSSEGNEDVEGDAENESSNDDGNDRIYGREHRELVRLCQRDDTYRLYSDDFAFRILTAQSDHPDGICTLDVLAGLQEVGLISQQMHAQKVSSLCAWHVGVVVRMDVITSLLPDDLASASSAKAGMERLDRQQELKAVLDAVWDFRLPFDKMLGHAAAVARAMADDDAFSGTVIAAFLGQWFVKATLKNDAPANALDALAKVFVSAAARQQLFNVSASKLWTAYLLLIEFHHGSLMDETRESEAIRLLGRECASIYKQDAALGGMLHSSLRSALTEGTSNDSHFVTSYSDALRHIGTFANRATR